MSTVNVETSQFVTENMPRVLRALDDAFSRIVALLSNEHQVHQLRSAESVRAPNPPASSASQGPVVMTMMGPAIPSGPPPPVLLPVLSGSLELRGASFELDARLFDRKRGASIPPIRHLVSGNFPRLASLLNSCQSALAALRGASSAAAELDCLTLLALLDSLDESIKCAQQFFSRSSAVGSSVQAVVERAAQLSVAPPTAGGLVFDVVTEDASVSVTVGYTDLALPAGSTPTRKAAWRALKARIRPHDADRHQVQLLRDRCRVVFESGMLRQVQTELLTCSATLNRARANLLALLSIERTTKT
jgi:hypothetical protein